MNKMEAGNRESIMISKKNQYLLLSEEERKQILFEFNRTGVEYPRDKTIHRLFEEQASRTPDSVSLVGRGWHPRSIRRQLADEMVQLTYKELNDKSRRLAYLLKEKGVKPDTIVGVMIDRSLEMIIGILGILKAGGAYLPIDPEYPRERIDYMLKDSNTRILLKKSEIAQRPISKSRRDQTNSNDRNSNDQNKISTPIVLIFEHLKFEFVSNFEFRASNLSSSNLSYIIYTSGTTGRPKGVAVEHRGVVNTLIYRKDVYRMDAAVIALQLFSYVFDGFVTSFFTPVIAGSRVILPSLKQVRDLAALCAGVPRYAVTHFIAVPLLFQAMLEHMTPAQAASLKAVTIAGDRLPARVLELSRAVNPGMEIVNEYGVTEASVMSTLYRQQEKDGTIKIGKPIANHRVYILDKSKRLQAIGIGGELCISGAGVTRGYLNNPLLTAEKFIYWSYRTYRTYSSYKVYRTGDLARWLPDGNIEFLGRSDFQVKIRGFRIELAEVENQLLQHQSVKQAVVCAKEDSTGERYLCAYLVTNQGEDVPGIREYLLKKVPDYMIPAYFVPLDKFPLTPGGKVDRNALPEPGIDRSEAYIPPGNPMEMELVKLWSAVMGIERHIIGIDDDFFRLGGHSLRAALVTAEIHKRFNVCLSLAEFFEISTVRALAEYIKKAERHEFIPINAAEKREYYVLSPAQKRFYFLHQLNPRSTAYNNFDVFVLEEKVDIRRLEKTFRVLMARHESLRTSLKLVDGEPVQDIHEKVEFEIEYIRVECGVESEADVIRRFFRPFDLSRPPLFRVGLSKMEKEKYLFLFDIHHIISDAISKEILIREFMMIYAGKEEKAAELELQYKDFSQWQNRLIDSGEMKRQEEYWLEQFSREVPLLDIPLDFERPESQSFEGDDICFEIPRRQVMKLREYAREEDGTMFPVLLTVFYILLSKLSGREDIVVGTPAAGRRHSDLYPIIGVFINTLALRNYPGADKGFDEFLREVKQATLQAFDHQDYPFEDLVKKVRGKMDSRRNPIFDALFMYRWSDSNLLLAADQTGNKFPSLSLKKYNLKYNKAVTDLVLTVAEVDSNDRFVFDIAYCTRLFKRETIEKFVEHFKEVVSAVVENKRIPLKEIKISHDLGEAKSTVPQIDFGF